MSPDKASRPLFALLLTRFRDDPFLIGAEMLYKWGLLVHRWRYLVISIVVGVFLLAAPMSANVLGSLSNGFGLADTE